MAITLASVIQRKVRQGKTQGFDAIQLYSCRVKLILDKSAKQRVFRNKAQVFRGWRFSNEQVRRERELEMVEM